MPTGDVGGRRCQASSISKQFVAASALLLVEHGDLTLHDPIARWLPAAPPAWDEITLHRLLSQTSGLGHWSSVPGWDVSNPPDAASLLATVAALPLLSPPGSEWRYSGPGYVLAAAIVAAVAAQPYSEFVRERIFEPRGMTSTTSGINPVGEDVATGHKDGAPVPLVPGLAGLPGTGDLWTTSADLIRYSQAFHSGGVVDLESVALMTSPQFAGDVGLDDGALRSEAYGYGLFIGTVAGTPAIFHPGDNPGFSSLLAWFPATETALAILTDDESSHIEGMLQPR